MRALFQIAFLFCISACGADELGLVKLPDRFSNHARQVPIEQIISAQYEFVEVIQDWRVGIGSPKFGLDGLPVISIKVLLQNTSNKERAYFDYGLHPFEFIIIDPKGTAWNLGRPIGDRFPVTRRSFWRILGGNQAEFILSLPILSRNLTMGDYVIYGRIRIPKVGDDPEVDLLSGNVIIRLTQEQVEAANDHINQLMQNPDWQTPNMRYIEPLGTSGSSFQIKSSINSKQELGVGKSEISSHAKMLSDPAKQNLANEATLPVRFWIIVSALLALGISASFIVIRAVRRGSLPHH
jgi:hypothetical protein